MRTRPTRTQTITWQPLGRLSVYLAAALVLAALDEYLMRRFGPGAAPSELHQTLPMLLGLIQIGLVVCMERLLAETSVRRAWQYRLAFLGGAGLGLLLWGLRLGPAGVWAAVGGAFVGGLLTTALFDGLWENNAPPAPEMEAEVLRRHTARLGPLPAGPWSKRVFDLALAGLGLAVTAPFWIVFTFLIWFEEPGPVLFVKNSVGKGGRNFHQFKFRTMVREAEKATGPVLARIGDHRVLWVGRLLRKTALDELPQLINILKGEMSFVGPRPQRTVLVHGYLQHLPEYAERHRVAPGLSGLAQVAGDYYLTPRQKLRFDRLYIHRASLGFDLKLLLLAFALTFWYRWKPDWNGRLPRRIFR